MRVAFLTHSDPFDKGAWSGILFHMIKALASHCDEVISLGPACQSLYFFNRAIRRSILLPLGKNIDPTHTMLISRALGSVFRQRLSQREFDVIFAPVGRTELGFLRTNIPIVYYTDLTACQFRNYARNLLNLTNWAVQQTEELERRAFAKADQIVLASEWAARSAVCDYGVRKDLISVVPMGANLSNVPSQAEILIKRISRNVNSCRILFLGVDWERKGGIVALDTMLQLRERGVNASLTVVGCCPPGGSTHANMEVVPFLDKSIPAQELRLRELLLNSDFMVFPTRREAFGIVCCEANAFGLPVIASDGGGVPIRNGRNGILLPSQATAFEYTNAIQALLADHGRYLDLVCGGRQYFDEHLNWDAWGKSMARIFDIARARPVRSIRPAALEADAVFSVS